MVKTIIDGVEYEIPEAVHKLMRSLFDSAEGIRVDLCTALGIDYLEASDKDIFDAIERIKHGNTDT